MSRADTHPILDAGEEASVAFSFEGARFKAREGEVISSALFANGIRVFGLHPDDGAPQGIFCANGQCSQCMVIANGKAVKACMTPVESGMQVHKLTNVPTVPIIDRESIDFDEIRDETCDLLIIGAGPSGLGAAIEAADAGLSVILVDDKDALGGKLLLQTHMFFGSVDQCYAGTRGIDIAEILAADVRKRTNIRVMLSTMAVGVYSDNKVGVVERGERYILISPRSLLVASGARERALVFRGCELPGVYGAGAFQTLLNRDLVKPAEKVFIVGGGNVGLIAAYHALQAGIQVVGLAEGLPEVGGYWVHADKIRRFGVPIYVSTTVLSANGTDQVESVTVAEVDDKWNIKPGTHRTYPCDTLLVAVGLESINELHVSAKQFGFDTYVAGDAEEIAEASAAMFSGRLTGRIVAGNQGRSIEIPSKWEDMVSTLKSKPGREELPIADPSDKVDVFPMIWCAETIPCNPCTMVCPQCAIEMPETGGMLSRSDFTGTCRACGKCVAVCPGLAITLVDMRQKAAGTALVTVPFELPVAFKEGDSVPAVDRKGNLLCDGTVVRIVDRQSRAPCSAACPAGVHAQGYIELIRKRRYHEAIELLRSDLPLPAVCGRVCYHPCEDVCPRADIDEPIAILALKRFVTDWAMQNDDDVTPLPVTQPEKVAVIGSGPSGLACANEVLKRGYQVTVFEAAPKAGGVLRYGIPSYRLPDEVLEWDLDCIQKRGVKIETGRKIDDLDALRESGFDCIYVSTGAPRSAALGIPGEDADHVQGALEFLSDVNAGSLRELSGTVAVIGGGNSALDAARAALRLGADQVKIVYRRTLEEMPAHDLEIDEAEREGVIFEFLAAPEQVEDAQLLCTRMKLGEPDDSGRRRPIPVKGSRFAVQADIVIVAVGQETELGSLAVDVEANDKLNIVADPITQATNMPDVFAGGDVVTGPATVVDAFGAGKRAAQSMHRFLRGYDPVPGSNREIPVLPAAAGDTAETQPRAQAAALAPDTRTNSFDEVVATLSEGDAARESERCLGCGAYSESLSALHADILRSHEDVRLVTIEVHADKATQVVGIRAQDPSVTEPIETIMPPDTDDDVVVCRCERVTLGQIRNAIRSGVRDMNQLKAMLRAGLGACGGKTCGPLIQAVFRQEGVPLEEVTYYTERPLVAEVPLGLFAGTIHKDIQDA